MPYRGGLETTLARCAQLQEHARDLERALGFPWRPPIEIGHVQEYDEACELERRLAPRRGHVHFSAAAHTHSWSEHCNVEVVREGNVCDVDVKCVTFSRHVHSDACISIAQPSGESAPYIEGILDGRTLHVQGDHGEPVDVELGL